MKKNLTARLPIIAGLLCALGLGMIPAEANANARADFVLKIVKFSSGYALNKPTFDICVVGGNAVYSALQKQAGQTMHKRKLRILKISSAAQAPGKQCNILYMGAGSASTAIYSRILTVSSNSGFAKEGGMVEYHSSGKSNLSVNMSSLNRANIKLSLSLVKLARTVYRK